MASLINKSRKPKFDVHLKISDLNNVPLVSGVSMIKWHLPHSIHGEHRGRTQKCPIVNHRVEYSYSKVIPVRIAIDRGGSLSECPIELEVLQEFRGGGIAGGSGRDEKITLGTIRLNLSEYVEESEGILRDGTTAAAIKEALSSPVQKSGHRRKRSSLSNVVTAPGDPSPRSSHDEERPATDVQDGVVRRYLMQDSKINSTLKISILMIQVDGERNYVAPAPKSAPMFGGIAGFVSGDAFEPIDTGATTPGQPPSSFSGKSRDMFEQQDMYRRALAASWASQPGELPADQCIEDIFAGGEGFATTPSRPHHHSHHHNHHHGRGLSRHHTVVAPTEPSPPPPRTTVDDSGSVSDDDDEEDETGDTMGTLRPQDVARFRRHPLHAREQSAASDRSTATLLGNSNGSTSERDLDRESSRGIGLDHRHPHLPHPHLPHLHHHHHQGPNPPPQSQQQQQPQPPQLREPFPSFPSSLHRREESKITHPGGGGLRSRSSSSLVSLATTLGSSERERDRDRGRDGFKRAREVDEFEVRDDLVAWSIPGGQYR